MITPRSELNTSSCFGMASCLSVLLFFSGSISAATFIDLVSEANEPFLEGVSVVYSPGNGHVIESEVRWTDLRIEVVEPSFRLSFGGYDDQVPDVGLYPNATIGGNSRIMLTNGASCAAGSDRGQFEVIEIEQAGSEVQKLALDFVLYCSGQSEELVGSIRINSDIAVRDTDTDTILDITDNCVDNANLDQLDTDTDGLGDECDPIEGVTFITMDGEAGEYISQGATLRFEREEVDVGSVYVFGEVQFSGGPYDFRFRAPVGSELEPGLYLNAARWPFSNLQAGLSVSGDGRGCNTLAGSFLILEWVVDDFNQVISAAIDYRQVCHVPSLTGAIRYNSELDYAESLDRDDDGLLNIVDRCPEISGTNADSDDDGIGDACDPSPHSPETALACFEDTVRLLESVDNTESVSTTLLASVSSLETELNALDNEVTDRNAEVALIDADADGVSDINDLCPASDFGENIDAIGCTVGQYCLLISVSNIHGFKACNRAIFQGTVNACITSVTESAGKLPVYACVPKA